MKKQIFYFVSYVYLFLELSINSSLRAVSPEEYNSYLGISKGLSGAGATFVSGLDSLHLNPALIAIGTGYKFLGSSILPIDHNRKHYSIGIIDSSSSFFAAALSYSSFAHDYNSSITTDSPIKDRINLALAHTFKFLSFGILVQRLRYHENNSVVIAHHFNAGFVTSFFNDTFRFGSSAANTSNTLQLRLNHPILQTYRLATSYSVLEKKITFLLDYKQKEKNLSNIRKKYLVAGIHGKVTSYLHLMGGFSHGLSENREEKDFSFGISLLSETMQLDYGFTANLSPGKVNTCNGILSVTYNLR